MACSYDVICGDCLDEIRALSEPNIALSFVDPPFNQGKQYDYFDDELPEEEYWRWMEDVLGKIYKKTVDSGAVYFMQREKNAERVNRALRVAGWHFQNMVIWEKKTSAVPSNIRYSKKYQIIVFATKGKRPRVFNRLRIDLKTPPGYKYERPNGVFVSDVWSDIREMTSGYYAGDEAIRDDNGDRFHKQQSPIALLLRIILSSSVPGDVVLDPFAGTGTTLTVAHQLGRDSIGIEIDPKNAKLIEARVKELWQADDINKYAEYYKFTENLSELWPTYDKELTRTRSKQGVLI